MFDCRAADGKRRELRPVMGAKGAGRARVATWRPANAL